MLLHNRAGGPAAAARAAFGALPAAAFSDHPGIFRSALRQLADTDAAERAPFEQVLAGWSW